MRPFRCISVGHILGNDSLHYLGGLEIKFPKGIVKVDLQDSGRTCRGRGSVSLGLFWANLKVRAVKSPGESHSVCFKGLSVGEEF